jgi:hypothetical protein
MFNTNDSDSESETKSNNEKPLINGGEAMYTSEDLLFNYFLESEIEFFSSHMSKSYIDGSSSNIPDFLEFHSSFEKKGKQGVLGLLKNNRNGKNYVYKMSQHLDFLIEQEFNVLVGLNSIRDFCPHFCKTLGKFQTRISQFYRKKDNPFDIDGDKVVNTDVLLIENIENSRKLYRYIKNEDVNPEIVMSLVKQTLLATVIANEKINFTHYDLHSNNVLIKKCNPNTVFLYILDDDRTYLVPTYGYYPVIIDFGFSYNKNCDAKPLYSGLAHTNIGFLTTMNDKNADAKLFLTSVSYEMSRNKKCDISSEFRYLVKKIYKNCDIDMECGWDNAGDNKLSISDMLLKKMKHQFKRSPFFKEQGCYIVEMLESLVILPMKPRETEHTIEDMTGVIVTEFMKIEKEISSEFVKMYIFKIIIESTRKYRKEYIQGGTSRNDAVKFFREDIIEAIDSMTKFCNPKINWEKLLCALLCISKTIEKYCYEKMSNTIADKKADYNNMLLKNTCEIYEALEANIPSHFEFDKDTVVYVWNSQDENSYIFKPPENLIEQINNKHPYDRGTILYKYTKDKRF